MGRVLLRLGLPLFGMVLTGCTVSPWWSRGAKETKPAVAATSPAKTASSTSQATAKYADSQDVQEVMAELRKLGVIDPAAQDKLMADLLQADPSLRPYMLTQARAMAAGYRRQAELRQAPPADATRTAANTTAPWPVRAFAPPTEVPVTEFKLGQRDNQSSARAFDSAPGSGSAVAGVASQETALARSEPARLPAADSQPRSRLDIVRRIPPPAAAARPATPPRAADSQVVPASYETQVPGNWRAQVAAAIRTLEAEVKASSSPQGNPALEAKLRMLYLLAGRREDALRPIASDPASLQDYWSKQLYGLDVWLDAERTPDAARRAAQTKQILGEAIARLGETSPLVVRKLAFCTAVQSYGEIVPFKKFEFSPEQEVLLYAEVDNFTAESTAKGFHTSLKSSYQVFDGRGQRVDDHELAPIEEYCQNYRRDFFISYHLRLPKRIYPGKHTLQLTVEDQKGHKVGQATVDFVAKAER